MKGSLIVLLSSILSATSNTLSKFWVNDGFSSIFVFFVRFFGAAVIYGIIMLFWNRKRFRVAKKDWGTMLLLGVCLFANVAGYGASMEFLDISISVVILYTYPAIVAVASIFLFHYRLTSNIVIALILTFTGLLLTLNLFSSNIGQISALGVIFSFSGALGAAGYTLVTKRLTDGYHVMTVNFYAFCVASFMLACCLPFVELPASVSLTDGLNLFSLAVLASLAYFFYALGINYIQPSKAAIICSSETAFCIIFAVVFLKESQTMTQLIGAALVIAAVVVLQIQFPLRKKLSETTPDMKS